MDKLIPTKPSNRTPSPESLYIFYESYFLKILNKFRKHQCSIGVFMTAYATLYNIDFSFTDLKNEYDKAFNQETIYENPIFYAQPIESVQNQNEYVVIDKLGNKKVRKHKIVIK
ncbi:MAG: hypothetical protein KA821_19230 [Chitinophagaceae bacterium]|nr:hypothetical protein [Chitinophagaceae bacterium]